jgi:hypothetical protein
MPYIRIVPSSMFPLDIWNLTAFTALVVFPYPAENNY